jgi:hypothetical protein
MNKPIKDSSKEKKNSKKEIEKRTNIPKRDVTTPDPTVPNRAHTPM